MLELAIKFFQKVNIVTSFVIDGNRYDTVPNNTNNSSNYKITDTEVVIESGVWKLRVNV